MLVSKPDERFAKVCEAAGIKIVAPSQVQFLNVNELERAASGRLVVLSSGLWPGISRGPAVSGRGDETASASREPWVDANGYWIHYLRTLYPARPPVLGYTPKLGNRVAPYDTLELALVEAWAAGGNYVLFVEPKYREALLRQDAKALTAWRSLGRTARWLQEHTSLFRQPPFVTITALVESGAATAEIANLLFRRNASPALARADDPPGPDAAHRLALVAANIKTPSSQIRARILAHAEAGAAVVTAAPADSAWWRVDGLKLVRSDVDRDIYAFGRGRVIAYKNSVVDPSEFALDVVDIVTHKRRPVRLWNAPAVVAAGCPARRENPALLILVNYGSPVDTEVQARLQGNFTNAVLLRPESGPLELKTARRDTTTEVMVPAIQRLAVVVFK